MTEGMFLTYKVMSEGEGSGSDAHAVLTVGGSFGSWVDLEGDDQLIATVGEGEDTESLVLAESSLLTLHSYSASFETDAAGSLFDLSFERGTAAADPTGAPSSVVTLPEGFELTEPEVGFEVSTSAEDGELVVSWDSISNEPMTISVDGDCFSGYIETEATDSGTHSIPVSNFADNMYDEMTSCTATITVERKKAGTVDSAFDGGIATGVQKRTLDIEITE
jgi:hypothetical protein